MCCTAGPARLSDTILYVGEVYPVSERGYPIHALGYQNSVQNLSSFPNAMILPFPALPGTMTQDNVLSTEDCPNILKNMATAIMPRSRGIVSDSILGSKSLSVQIFEHDIYTVILAQDARLVPEALKTIESRKRPSIPSDPSEFFNAYSEWYPKWPIAVCCFDNKETKLAKPLLWWYKPLNPQYLFAPALDSHTGDIPDLNEMVDVDHTIIVGSSMSGRQPRLSTKVHFIDDIPRSVQPYLLSRVVGGQHKGILRNGDFVFEVEDVRGDSYRPYRVSPLDTELKSRMITLR
jgi:hypothetical protein